MNKIEINGESFYVYDKKPVYWNCFFFCTQIPMNRLWNGNSNGITVNGRSTPFAKVIIHIPSVLKQEQISTPIVEWRLNFPIYAIHYTVLKIEWEDFYRPPIPEECYLYYKRFKKKVHYDEREGISEN